MVEGVSLPSIVKQVGFCLVCGNGVHSDQPFTQTEQGVCHETCVEKRSF